jgi:hypothetical protein
MTRAVSPTRILSMEADREVARMPDARAWTDVPLDATAGTGDGDRPSPRTADAGVDSGTSLARGIVLWQSQLIRYDRGDGRRGRVTIVDVLLDHEPLRSTRAAQGVIRKRRRRGRRDQEEIGADTRFLGPVFPSSSHHGGATNRTADEYHTGLSIGLDDRRVTPAASPCRGPFRFPTRLRRVRRAPRSP